MQNYYFSFKTEKQNIPFVSLMAPLSSHVAERGPVAQTCQGLVWSWERALLQS